MPSTRALKLTYEILMAALALATIVLALRPSTELSERTINGIWMVFVVDYVVRLVFAKERLRFVRTHWLDVVAILPGSLFRAARLFRFLRVLRVLRAMAVLWRVSGAVRGVLKTNQLGYVLTFSAVMIIAGGVLISQVEPELGSLSDGLWWSLVTSTTVGYGDMSPRTGEGRAIAAVLMLIGIGTIGMITGSIATYFIGVHESRNVHVRHIQAQLSRWDAMTSEERRQLKRQFDALDE